MTTVAGLFDSQKSAENAIEALAKKPFADDMEFTVIEEEDEMVAGAIPGGSGSVALSAPMTIVRGKVDALDVDDEAEVFLRQGVKRGGVIVAVECDDEYAADVEATMRKHDAQFEEVD